MKKIYILTAVFALLTLSLNAQVADKGKDKISDKKGTVDTRQAKFKPNTKVPTMNELLSSIKGMSTVMQASSFSQNDAVSPNAGPWRAPLKINADEYTVGPFEGNNVGSSSLGYLNAYPNPQWITITTQLTRDEFIDHVGDEIVGFRLALGGNTSHLFDVSDFIAFPITSSGTDMDNVHEWSIADFTGPIVYNNYTLYNDDITSSNFTTGNITPSAPWTANSLSNQSNGSFYITDRTNGYLRFTVPEGFSNSDFKFVFSTRDSYYNGYFTFTPSSGSAQTINTSAANTEYSCELTGLNAGDVVTITGRYGSAGYSCDFTYMHVYVKGTYNADYGQLNGAYTGSDPNWHEFYLPEPIEFNVASDVQTLRMGYTVRQYPESDTEHYLYPIALNDQSKSHNHYIYMYYPQTSTGMMRLTGWDYATDGVTFPSGWTVPNTNDGELDGSIYFSGMNGGNLVINSSVLQGATTVTVKVTAGKEDSGNSTINVNDGSNQALTQALVEYTFENVDATNGITISYSDYYVDFSKIEIYGEGTSTEYVQQWYSVDYSENGDLPVQLIFKSNLPKTDTPTITVGDPTATSVTVTATATDPTASVTLTIGDRTETGTGSVSITIDRGTADQNLTATATAQEDGKRVSDEATAPVSVPALPVTPTPSITYEVVGNTMVITATGQGTVTLQVDGQTASGEGTAQITLPLGSDERTVTATATALAPNHQPSAEATATITLPEAGRTPMPVITYVEHNGYVEIIATGDGTITLEAGGQTAGGVGSASIIIVRSLEDQNITATATAKAEGLEESHPATEDILVEALSTTPTAQTKEGLLRLHLLIVDQMKQEIPADNSHPDVYGYVLKYEPNGPGGEGTRESGTVDVRIQKADCEVMGAYTLTEVDNDKNIGRRDEQGNIVHDQGIKMQVITADVAYDLSSTNDMLWEYILQGAENRLPNYNQDYLTRLQKTQNFTYVEMLDGTPDKGHEYPNGEHHYFSAYNPVTGVFNADNLETGAYATDYMTYAPSVSTWGVQRRYFEDDGLDNTYGAPYWKTAAGQVTMDDSELMAERQKNQWNSVNWTTDAGTASLYILDKVKAVGLLPHTDIATVQYEPYMFRIFVESPSGKLRPYKVVEAVEGSDTEGEHLEALVPDNQLTDAQKYGPISVWESYIKYDEDGNIIGADAENGVMISTGPDKEHTSQTAYTFQKNKVKRDATPEPTEENPHPAKPIWDKDSNNAMFGALNAISPETGKISTDDLKVFVRFYYAVKGELADHTVVRYSAGNRGEGSRSGNGAESGGGSAGAATSVFEIDYHGEVVGQTYYNIQGMESEKPFDGVNIVVTRYSDGSTSVAKIVR